MKWIKLTQETFKDLQTEYNSGKSIVICNDYTKDFGKEFYIYFIYILIVMLVDFLVL